MTPEQDLAIACAFADLCGALQDYEQRGSGDSYHDWDAHRQSIADMANAFNLETPEDCK